MHPKELKITDFSYSLPQEKIALFPLAQRDSSKLLIYKNENISENTYKNLAEILPADTHLIFNNTRVVEARLIFKKTNGGNIEIFCMEPDDTFPDISHAMQQKRTVNWKCLVGGAKKWKEQFLIKPITLNDETLILSAKIIEKRNDYFIINFTWNNELCFSEILHLNGLIPLPPYLNRQPDEKDKTSYQTTYASIDGSVAAPTAGLHFTTELINRLSLKNITHSFVTLHVGAGTFKPVKTDYMKDHEMHAEFIEIPDNFIETLLQLNNKNIITVGTTSLRTIESLYWMGAKINELTKAGHKIITIEDISVQQWDPYEIHSTISSTSALLLLLNWMKENHLKQLITKTQIIIAPGYSFKIINGLITNFHQPQSTLLLLVAALIGDHWKSVYQYALTNDFRFLSYGDGCLLWKSST
jgi:S-adenosylmethionine:tRNA ribosyltransferase-isomerase